MSKKKQESINPIDVALGAKIRNARNQAGKSQKKLGDDLNLTFQQVQKYESGKNRVSAATLYEISKVLQTPVGQFFAGIDNTFAPIPIGSDFILADSAESQYIADEDTIIQCFAKITDIKTKELIVVLLRHLAQVSNR
jgi:transcriptional regulator with XRE-family HTH domain